jgi:hypothetical protein
MAARERLLEAAVPQAKENSQKCRPVCALGGIK